MGSERKIYHVVAVFSFLVACILFAVSIVQSYLLGTKGHFRRDFYKPVQLLRSKMFILSSRRMEYSAILTRLPRSPMYRLELCRSTPPRHCLRGKLNVQDTNRRFRYRSIDPESTRKLSYKNHLDALEPVRRETQNAKAARKEPPA